MPRLSSFNHFCKWRDDFYLAYNAQSGAMASMTSDNFVAYQKLAEKLNNRNTADLSTDEQTLLEQLEFGRFVVSDSKLENEWLKFRHRQARFDSSSLGLAIAPTMACDTACEYCFELDKRGRMSAAVIESLITFIENRAPALRDMQITWYGGEPLLAMDIVEDLTQAFLDLATEYRFDYSATMVSNGYRLNCETTDRLVDLRVTRIQVTLDGPSRVHDEKRPLRDGEASFDTIIGNVVYACTRIPISVRVNIDPCVRPEIIAEFLEELKLAGLQDKVSLLPRLLEPAARACANISEGCYGRTDFSAVEKECYQQFSEHGFVIDKLPSPMRMFCVAQLANSFLVDPEGELYRCFDYTGDKGKSMGNIQQDVNYRHPEFAKLFKFDPFEDVDCRQCNILPICLGGCPAKRLDLDLPKNQVCENSRHNLHPIIELIARSHQQQLQRQRSASVERKTR